MKVPLRFQITEFDCGTVSLLNAFSYLYEREQIPALLVKQIHKYTLDCYDENGYVGIPLYDTLKDIWEIKEQYIYSLIVFVKRDSLDADSEVYEGLSNNTRKDLN